MSSSESKTSPPILQRLFTIVEDIGVIVEAPPLAALLQQQQQQETSSSPSSSITSQQANNLLSTTTASSSPETSSATATTNLATQLLNTTSTTAGSFSPPPPPINHHQSSFTPQQSRQVRLREQVAKMFGGSKLLLKRMQLLQKQCRANSTQNISSISAGGDAQNKNGNEPAAVFDNCHVTVDISTENSSSPSALSSVLAKQTNTAAAIHLESLKDRYGFTDEFLDMENQQEGLLVEEEEEEEQNDTSASETPQPHNAPTDVLDDNVVVGAVTACDVVADESSKQVFVSGLPPPPSLPRTLPTPATTATFTKTSEHLRKTHVVNDHIEEWHDVTEIIRIEDRWAITLTRRELIASDRNASSSSSSFSMMNSTNTTQPHDHALMYKIYNSNNNNNNNKSSKHFGSSGSSSFSSWRRLSLKRKTVTIVEHRCQILLSSTSAMIQDVPFNKNRAVVSGNREKTNNNNNNNNMSSSGASYTTSFRREFEEYQFRFSTLITTNNKKSVGGYKNNSEQRNQENEPRNANDAVVDGDNNSGTEDDDDVDVDTSDNDDNNNNCNDKDQSDDYPETGLFMKRATNIHAAYPYFLIDESEIIRKDRGVEISKSFGRGCSGLPLFSAPITITTTIPNNNETVRTQLTATQRPNAPTGEDLGDRGDSKQIAMEPSQETTSVSQADRPSDENEQTNNNKNSIQVNTTYVVVLGVLVGRCASSKDKLVFLNIPSLTAALRNASEFPNSSRLCGCLRYLIDSAKVHFLTGVKKQIDTSSEDDDDEKTSGAGLNNNGDDDDDNNEEEDEDEEDDAAIMNSLREQVNAEAASVGGRPAEVTSKLVANEPLFQNITRKSSETKLYDILVERILIEEKKSRFSATSTDREDASQRLTALRQLSLKLETTVGVRHVQRDCIGNAKGYALTCSWILNMIFSFFMLVVVTCINSHMLDLGFMTRPYIVSSDGCFYQSITECCQPNVQPFADKPEKTCMRNEETFDHYSARWLEFVFNRSEVGDCAGMLYAIGGNRYEKKIDSPVYLVVSNWENGDPNSSPPAPTTTPPVFPAPTPIGRTKTPSLSRTPQVSYAALRQYFQTVHCPNSEICQRFLILNSLSAKKTWRGGTSLSIAVSYNVFIEGEWQLVDSNCRRNLRILPVPTTFEVGSPGYLYIVAVALVLTLLMFVCYIWWKNRRSTRLFSSLRPRGNYLLYWMFWLALIISCVVLIAVISVWLAPSPYAFIILIIVSFINFAFFIIHVTRWSILILREAAMTTKERDERIIAQWNEYVTEQIFGFNIPNAFFINNWGGTKLIAYGGCCCFFIAASLEMYQTHFNNATARNEEPLERFLIYAKWRPFFRIIQIAFAPIGLELVIYFPSFMCNTAKLPNTSYILLIYIFVFMALSSNDLLLPTTIGEVTSAVISFTSQITTFLGPVDDVTGRLLDLVGGCALVSVVLQVLQEMDEEREEKPRRVMMALTWKTQSWSMSSSPLWETFPTIEPLFLDQRFSQTSSVLSSSSSSSPSPASPNDQDHGLATSSTTASELNSPFHTANVQQSAEDRQLGACTDLGLWTDAAKRGVPLSPKVVHLLTSIIRRLCHSKEASTLILCPHHVRILAGVSHHSVLTSASASSNQPLMNPESVKAVQNFVRNQIRTGKFSRICGIFAVQEQNVVIINNRNNEHKQADAAHHHHQDNQQITTIRSSAAINDEGALVGFSSKASYRFHAFDLDLSSLLSSSSSSSSSNSPQQQQPSTSLSKSGSKTNNNTAVPVTTTTNHQLVIYQSFKPIGVTKNAEENSQKSTTSNSQQSAATIPSNTRENAIQKAMESKYPMMAHFLNSFVRNKSDGLGLKVRLHESYDVTQEANIALRESGIRGLNKLVDLVIPFHGEGLLSRQRLRTLIKLHKNDSEQISANVSKVMFSE